tara:strand:+ start:208 stop:570 length:363 start_codon:yes stop_codon:yes gene_type:complete
MGFVSFVNNLGGKVADAGHRLGKQIHHGLHQGAKFVNKHADQVASAASKVGKIAGVVGKVASMALPFTAEIPIIGEVVGAAAAGGKAVEKAANLIERGAKVAKKVSQAELAMDRAMKYSG